MRRGSTVFIKQGFTSDLDDRVNVLAWKWLAMWVTASRQSGGPDGNVSVLSSAPRQWGEDGRPIATACQRWQQAYPVATSEDLAIIMKRMQDRGALREYVFERESEIVSRPSRFLPQN